MRIEKLLGTAVYQMEAVPKRSRTAQRLDVSCTTEYAIRIIDPSEAVADAVVATEIDPHGPRTPQTESYLGYDGGLWQPVYERGLGADRNYLHFPELRDGVLCREPLNRASEWLQYPLRNVDDPATGFANHLFHVAERMHDEGSFEGEVFWTNKARAIALHQEVAERLLLVVGDVVYSRQRGPVWLVTDKSGLFKDRGFVQLSHRQTTSPSTDAFAPQKLDIAKAWCRRRWKRDPVQGSVEHFDERFVDNFESARLAFDRLHRLTDKALAFVPFWPPEAVDCYLKLSAELRVSNPLQIFGVRDASAARALAASLRPHVATYAVPASLRATAKEVLADIDRMEDLAAHDPTLFPGLDAEQLAALETVVSP